VGALSVFSHSTNDFAHRADFAEFAYKEQVLIFIAVNLCKGWLIKRKKQNEAKQDN